MSPHPFNLAIETSGPIGSITLGKGDEILESLVLTRPGSPVAAAGVASGVTSGVTSGGGGKSHPRSSADLMPAVDQLCQRHFASPRDLGEVYLSTGPGSFTGLRVAVATAKMLARFLDARLVAVSTLEATAMNVMPGPDDPQHLALCLNVKKKTAYAAIFRRDGTRWEMTAPPALQSVRDLLSAAPRPLLLLGQTLTDQDIAGFPGVRLLPAAMAQSQSDAVWTLGRQMARAGLLADPLALEPVYARPPEAVELWNQRHSTPA